MKECNRLEKNSFNKYLVADKVWCMRRSVLFTDVPVKNIPDAVVYKKDDVNSSVAWKETSQMISVKEYMRTF